jgi:hypothetical protein
MTILLHMLMMQGPYAGTFSSPHDQPFPCTYNQPHLGPDVAHPGPHHVSYPCSYAGNQPQYHVRSALFTLSNTHFSLTLPLSQAPPDGDPALRAADYVEVSSPAAVTAADLDQDGVDDIITVSTATNTLTVLLGAGDGTFRPPQTLETGPGPRHVIAADLDGDGWTDLASANSDGTVSVFLATGTEPTVRDLRRFFLRVRSMQAHPPPSSFGKAQSVTLGASGGPLVGLAAVDVNGDGRLDLVTTGSTSTGGVSVLVAPSAGADGGFLPAKEFSLPLVNKVAAMATGDVNK